MSICGGESGRSAAQRVAYERDDLLDGQPVAFVQFGERDAVGELGGAAHGAHAYVGMTVLIPSGDLLPPAAVELPVLQPGMVGFAPCEGKAKKTGVVDQKVSLSWRRLNRSLDQRQPADTVRVEQTRY